MPKITDLTKLFTKSKEIESELKSFKSIFGKHKSTLYRISKGKFGTLEYKNNISEELSKILKNSKSFDDLVKQGIMTVTEDGKYIFNTKKLLKDFKLNKNLVKNLKNVKFNSKDYKAFVKCARQSLKHPSRSNFKKLLGLGGAIGLGAYSGGKALLDLLDKLFLKDYSNQSLNDAIKDFGSFGDPKLSKNQVNRTNNNGTLSYAKDKSKEKLNFVKIDFHRDLYSVNKIKTEDDILKEIHKMNEELRAVLFNVYNISKYDTRLEKLQEKNIKTLLKLQRDTLTIQQANDLKELNTNQSKIYKVLAKIQEDLIDEQDTSIINKSNKKVLSSSSIGISRSNTNRKNDPFSKGNIGDTSNALFSILGLIAFGVMAVKTVEFIKNLTSDLADTSEEVSNAIEQLGITQNSLFEATEDLLNSTTSLGNALDGHGQGMQFLAQTMLDSTNDTLDMIDMESEFNQATFEHFNTVNNLNELNKQQYKAIQEQANSLDLNSVENIFDTLMVTQTAKVLNDYRTLSKDGKFKDLKSIIQSMNTSKTSNIKATLVAMETIKNIKIQDINNFKNLSSEDRKTRMLAKKELIKSNMPRMIKGKLAQIKNGKVGILNKVFIVAEIGGLGYEFWQYFTEENKQKRDDFINSSQYKLMNDELKALIVKNMDITIENYWQVLTEKSVTTAIDTLALGLSGTTFGMSLALMGVSVIIDKAFSVFSNVKYGFDIMNVDFDDPFTFANYTNNSQEQSFKWRQQLEYSNTRFGLLENTTSNEENIWKAKNDLEIVTDFEDVASNLSDKGLKMLEQATADIKLGERLNGSRLSINYLFLYALESMCGRDLERVNENAKNINTLTYIKMLNYPPKSYRESFNTSIDADRINKEYGTSIQKFDASFFSSKLGDIVFMIYLMRLKIFHVKNLTRYKEFVNQWYSNTSIPSYYVLRYLWYLRESEYKDPNNLRIELLGTSDQNVFKEFTNQVNELYDLYLPTSYIGNYVKIPTIINNAVDNVNNNYILDSDIKNFRTSKGLDVDCKNLRINSLLDEIFALLMAKHGLATLEDVYFEFDKILAKVMFVNNAVDVANNDKALLDKVKEDVGEFNITDNQIMYHFIQYELYALAMYKLIGRERVYQEILDNVNKNNGFLDDSVIKNIGSVTIADISANNQSFKLSDLVDLSDNEVDTKDDKERDTFSTTKNNIKTKLLNDGIDKESIDNFFNTYNRTDNELIKEDKKEEYLSFCNTYNLDPTKEESRYTFIKNLVNRKNVENKHLIFKTDTVNKSEEVKLNAPSFNYSDTTVKKNYVDTKNFSELLGSEVSSPLDRSLVITSDYGDTNGQHNRKGGHGALDIRTQGELPLKSISDGVVVATKIDPNGKGGNYIIIKTPNNKFVKYMHLSSISVKQGQTVKNGEYIGKSGNSGRSANGKAYNHHLHIGISDSKGIDGQKYDPKIAFKQGNIPFTYKDPSIADNKEYAQTVAPKNEQSIEQTSKELVTQSAKSLENQRNESGQSKKELQQAYDGGDFGEGVTNDLFAISEIEANSKEI